MDDNVPDEAVPNVDGRRGRLSSKDLSVLRDAAALLGVPSSILIRWASNNVSQGHEQHSESYVDDAHSFKNTAKEIALANSNQYVSDTGDYLRSSISLLELTV
jgi:hypothetical protein